MAGKKVGEDWDERELKPYKGYRISKWRVESEDSDTRWSRWFYTAWRGDDPIYDADNLEELRKMINEGLAAEKAPTACAKCKITIGAGPEDMEYYIGLDRVCAKCFEEER